MPRTTVEIWGLNEVNDLLEKLPNSLSFKFVQDTYAEIAKMGVLKEAKRLVPVGKKAVVSKKYASRSHLPGNLKRSLGIIRGKNKKYPTVFAGVRSKNIFGRGGRYDGWYAHMIEYGTVKQPPQPFMRPAWAMWKGKTESMIGKAFGKQITRYAKRMAKKHPTLTRL